MTMAISRLAGKVALVTGAAQGIGAGIARRFAAEGARVVIQHDGDRQGAARVAADIVWRGGEAFAVEADITHWPDIRRLYEETLATFGTPDILVNSAGLARRERNGDAAANPERDAADMFGAMLMCQEAVRLFGVRGGSIINLAEALSCTMAPTEIDDATPPPIDAMTRGLARAFGPRKVRVTAIIPSISGAAIDVLDGSVINRQFVAVPPHGRSAAPDAVARVAVALACDDAAEQAGPQLMAAGG